MKYEIDEYRNLMRTLERKDFKSNSMRKVGLLARHLIGQQLENGVVDEPSIVKEIEFQLEESNLRAYDREEWHDRIVKCVKKSCKEFKPLVHIENIKISKQEMLFVQSFSSKPMKRLIFIMLVYAKMFDKDGWIYCDRKYFSRDANILMGSMEFNKDFIFPLVEHGVIETSDNKNNNATRITYMDNIIEEVAIEITDFYDLLCWMYAYENGFKPYACKNCGVHFFKTGRNSKYCKECSADIANEKSKFRMKKMRNS